MGAGLCAAEGLLVSASLVQLAQTGTCTSACAQPFSSGCSSPLESGGSSGKLPASGGSALSAGGIAGVVTAAALLVLLTVGLFVAAGRRCECHFMQAVVQLDFADDKEAAAARAHALQTLTPLLRSLSVLRPPSCQILNT